MFCSSFITGMTNDMATFCSDKSGKSESGSITVVGTSVCCIPASPVAAAKKNQSARAVYALYIAAHYSILFQKPVKEAYQWYLCYASSFVIERTKPLKRHEIPLKIGKYWDTSQVESCQG